MNPELAQRLTEHLSEVTGFIYPNEVEIQWGILVVVYPYITGLVAGAFILASLVQLFSVKEVQPTYRLALLTALSFLLIAPLPLLLHLGHPLRSYEIFLTPQLKSAMAMFGFVYLWYLMAVLLLELWFEFRKDLVLWSKDAVFPMNLIYRILSFFSTDISERAVAFDHKAIRIITLIGVPSAFLLHGYVGFIFGSVKANPWWGSVLMPLVFLMSAIVSGIALVIFLYMVVAPLKGQRVDMRCLDKITSYLFYAVIVDFTLEVLDFIHRLYQSEESIKILSRLVMDKLFVSLWVIQVLLGMLVPLAVMVAVKSLKFTEELRRLFYFASVILIQLGIFATRWNVVIGVQLFSKSFRGLTTYKMEVVGIEGLFVAIALLIAPFIILTVFLKIFPAWETESAHEAAS